MKNQILIALVTVLSVLFIARGTALAQSEEAYGSNPPIAQPLVREGDLALKLAEALGLGTYSTEEEAEGALNGVGIAPRNGWLSDYPVTPDIAGEVQGAVGDAAAAGRLTMEKDSAISIFQNVLSGYNMAVKPAPDEGQTQGSVYDSSAIESYYDTEGPPVVTYYAPPPSQAYLYTWVPYPFWWWDIWFPGFFVLSNFDIRVRPHQHWHEREHDVFIRNHFREPRTGRFYRVDPTNRFHRENFRWGGDARGFGTSRPFFGERGERRGGQRPPGLQPPVSTQRPPAAPQRPPAVAPPAVTPPVTTRPRPSYGAPRPVPGTRSNVFERFGNSRFEGRASDRGFRSRSDAGQVPQARPQMRPQTRPQDDRGSRDRGDSDRGGFRDRQGGTFHGRGRP